MGWDIIQSTIKDDSLIKGLEPLQRYYFVHSYYAVCDSEENVLMRCEYGYSFTKRSKSGQYLWYNFTLKKAINLVWLYLKILRGGFEMYYRPRLIPCLLLQEHGLVKTTQFFKS